jgi:tripartite-type tricarboxylate transporter receptor subunit TctC
MSRNLQPASLIGSIRKHGSRLICSLSMALALFCASYETASAQNYPTRSVRLVVPYGVGGTVDIFARSVAQKLGESLGAPFVVENIPGANGIVGSEPVARAPKDGYTLLMVAQNHAINPGLYPKIPFNPIDDFSGISLVGSVVQVLSVNPSVPAKTLQELVDHAKKQPGKLNFASTGNGSPTHLYAELLKATAGVDMVHVPYKAAGQALTALVSKEVDASFLVMTSMLPQAKAGRVVPLAVVGTRRSPLAPDLPTFTESGFKGFEQGSWVALIAPSGVPRPIIDRLNKSVRQALEASDLRDRLLGQGVDVFGSTPEEVDRLMRADAAKWGDLVRKLGLKAE